MCETGNTGILGMTTPCETIFMKAMRTQDLPQSSRSSMFISSSHIRTITGVL